MFTSNALHEFRLEVKEVDMAGSPGHEELDDAFGLGRMMQLAVGRIGSE